ncbi:hypothetical protein FGO68_gene5861 [Halteria grandinella]|uniref:Uncharacterized protein n=1 Tax=Halteria grandinella TaxID=5974 RepID=A0A8J8NPY8_HALGN|nr:hypothetical protein FGO68_gene5861 [Halteria grandinella]
MQIKQQQTSSRNTLIKAYRQPMEILIGRSFTGQTGKESTTIISKTPYSCAMIMISQARINFMSMNSKRAFKRWSPLMISSW